MSTLRVWAADFLVLEGKGSKAEGPPTAKLWYSVERDGVTFYDVQCSCTAGGTGVSLLPKHQCNNTCLGTRVLE